MHEHHPLDYTCIPLCVLLISQTYKKSTFFPPERDKRHPVNSEEALVGLNNGKGDCLWWCSCGEWGSHEYRQLFSLKSTWFEIPPHSYKSAEALWDGKTELIQRVQLSCCISIENKRRKQFIFLTHRLYMFVKCLWN